MPSYNLFTDGSESERIGGWGFVLENVDPLVRKNGIVRKRGSNRMELEAIVKGLEEIKEPSEITVFTDSMFVIGGVKKPKKYMFRIELWRQLFDLLDYHRVTFIKVGKNNHHPKHREAHYLAREAIR